MDQLSDPVISQQTRRGRPKNHRLDELCTRMWFWQLTQRVTAEPHKEVSTIWAATNGKLGSIQTLKLEWEPGTKEKMVFRILFKLQINEWKQRNLVKPNVASFEG